MKVLIIITITLLILAIDFPNTLGQYFADQLLCNDTSVSDDNLTGWLDAQRKCFDEYEQAKLLEKDDCEEESDFVNDKVKLPKNKQVMHQTCSPEYVQCAYNRTRVIQSDTLNVSSIF